MERGYHPLIYVAGAYNGDVSANIQKAEDVSISLIRNGWHVITPHKNTAGYEQYEDGVLTKKTWITMDLNILERCDALYVMDNWRTSVGTQEEINFAATHDIPKFFEEAFPSTNFFPGKMAEYYSVHGA
jgi:hypothetical protein